MHGKLTLLRSRLEALQSRRALVRWASALCAVLAVMFALWAVAFLFDWSLRLSLGYRAAALCGWLAGLAWACRKFVWPAAMTRETVEDLALLVERRHQIDSDLIAALQFESPAAAQWGSSRLSSAVVDYVAAFSPSLNVFEGFSFHPLPHRAAVAGALLLLAASAFAFFPGEARAFWTRFWLGSARYPSRTILSELAVNGQSIPVIARNGSARLRLPQGTPLQLRAVCRGEIPTSGLARLRNRADRVETRFELKPAEPGTFVAEHPLPSGDVDLQIEVGDTWSDPATIRVVPLPIVDVRWHVIPPKYAASENRDASAGSRHLAVLEGSRLMLSVHGVNKALTRVQLRIEDEMIELTPSGTAREAVWTLPGDSPLNVVSRNFNYELNAVDEDGLSLNPPVAGSVRLKSDRAPRVAAAVVTRLVIPTARPRLAFGAVDDYGLAEVRLQMEVVHENGDTETHTQSLRRFTDDDRPTTFRDEIRLDLSGCRLEKGDELRLTVQALDDRGEFEPNVGVGEPLVLKVTDRSGILAGLNESDQFSVKQLDTIIQRELGIGGDKR